MKNKLSTKAFEPKYKLNIQSATSHSARRLFDPKYRYVIDYDIKLSNGKNLQRDFVWTIEQKRSLIVSLMKELQIPNFAIVVYQDDSLSHKDRVTTYKIIDGKQRLKTIEEFYKGEFGLLVDGVEYFYNDLDDMAQYRVIDYSLLFNVVYEYPDTKLSDDQLISWFELVNFAGTSQDLDHLEKLKDK